MTAPLRAPPQSQLPASQTAPVAEFRCLYTPDVRKKQKKWQDGFLKFHTFNNRVMVYDQARNFLGDTYYKDSNELHEGDELTLDKGVMVEVADAVGVTQTDLKPLFEKKPKDAPPPPTAPPRRFQPPSQVARPPPTPANNPARTNAQQLRHKSLNTVLGTPKGPIGKSVPIKSPYDARQEKEREKENDIVVESASKRQKTIHKSDNSATLRSYSPTLESTRAPKESQLLQVKTSHTKPRRKPTGPIPQDAPVITLDELDEVAQPSSQASLPSTLPVVLETAPESVLTPAQPVRPSVTSKPAPRTPKLPRGRVPVPSVKALETPQAPVAPSSPPVSASNRLANVDFAIQPTPAKEPSLTLFKETSPPTAPESFKTPPRNPKAKSLRLSKGVKRGTLMICQPQTTLSRSRDLGNTRFMSGRLKAGSNVSAESNLSAQRPIPTALAPTNVPKETPTALHLSKSMGKAASQNGHVSEQMHRRIGECFNEFDDDPEIVHGLMDKQLLVPGTPPPEPLLVPDSPGLILSRPKTVTAATHTIRKTGTQKPKELNGVITASPPAQASPLADPTRIFHQELQAMRKPSPSSVATAEATSVQKRAASPALSAVSESRSRTTPLSPQKLSTLSTGGFRKRSKRTSPQPTHPVIETDQALPRNETGVDLPPHPLRANKKGPVMTTTELAAMLQQPKKQTKALADPIEDRSGATATSPNRKFRRVRSESDAPIPSTSEDWEMRNLPKVAAAAAAIEPVVAAATLEPPAVVARKKSGLAALIKKTDPRKKFVRTQSLTVETNVLPAQETESPMMSPVADSDIGPWSTEAYDLFDWRPPGWEGPGT